MKPSILIVDDEPGVRSALTGVLRDEGYEVESVPSGEACLERVTRGPVDLIVLDVWLPGMDGLATLARLRERQVDAQIVLISGHGNIESAVRAIKMGAFDFVEKPLSLEKTVLVVRNALRQRRLEAENRALRARVDHDQTMSTVFSFIVRVAAGFCTTNPTSRMQQGFTLRMNVSYRANTSRSAILAKCTPTASRRFRTSESRRLRDPQARAALRRTPVLPIPAKGAAERPTSLPINHRGRARSGISPPSPTSAKWDRTPRRPPKRVARIARFSGRRCSAKMA